MAEAETVTGAGAEAGAGTGAGKDRAALRGVVDLALRGIRARAKSPHPARQCGEARWVMSSDGVIDAPGPTSEA